MTKVLFVLFVATVGLGGWLYLQVPSPQTLRGCLTAQMNQVKLCPGSKDYAPLGSISPYLQKAVVMSEDATFWNHKGFDWEEIEKSARENWETGAYKRGGSTITQQLAKNLFLSRDKTLLRKLQEALITNALERSLKKTEILERYLNVIEFGPNLFGVKAATAHYFKKSPANLSLVESAFLVMLLPSPKKYAKSFHQKALTPFAEKRVRRIISDLQRTGKVSTDEAAAALEQMSYFLGGEPEPDAASLPDEETPTEE